MKKFKENGITLIALVITIVVMIILAGVAIAMLAPGDSNIFTQAADAKEAKIEGEKRDEVYIAEYDEYIGEKGEFSKLDLDKICQKVKENYDGEVKGKIHYSKNKLEPLTDENKNELDSGDKSLPGYIMFEKGYFDNNQKNIWIWLTGNEVNNPSGGDSGGGSESVEFNAKMTLQGDYRKRGTDQDPKYFGYVGEAIEYEVEITEGADQVDFSKSKWVFTDKSTEIGTDHINNPEYYVTAKNNKNEGIKVASLNSNDGDVSKWINIAEENDTTANTTKYSVGGFNGNAAKQKIDVYMPWNKNVEDGPFKYYLHLFLVGKNENNKKEIIMTEKDAINLYNCFFYYKAWEGNVEESGFRRDNTDSDSNYWNNFQLTYNEDYMLCLRWKDENTTVFKEKNSELPNRDIHIPGYYCDSEGKHSLGVVMGDLDGNGMPWNACSVVNQSNYANDMQAIYFESGVKSLICHTCFTNNACGGGISDIYVPNTVKFIGSDNFLYTGETASNSELNNMCSIINGYSLNTLNLHLDFSSRDNLPLGIKVDGNNGYYICEDYYIPYVNVIYERDDN